MSIGERLISLGKSLRIQHRNAHRKYTYAKLEAVHSNKIDPALAAYQIRMMFQRSVAK
jgi:hypothetical protein